MFEKSRIMATCVSIEIINLALFFTNGLKTSKKIGKVTKSEKTFQNGFFGQSPDFFECA